LDYGALHAGPSGSRRPIDDDVIIGQLVTDADVALLHAWKLRTI
jgi:hypothetical protein